MTPTEMYRIMGRSLERSAEIINSFSPDDWESWGSVRTILFTLLNSIVTIGFSDT